MDRSFICLRQPRSINAEKKQSYLKALIDAFCQRYPGHIAYDGELYGKIYYFCKKRIGMDADNISKPIWDALANTAYKDDKQVGLRIAGIFNLGAGANIQELNLTEIPEELLPALLDGIDNQDHILYIEFGDLDYRMFKFGRGI